VVATEDPQKQQISEAVDQSSCSIDKIMAQQRDQEVYAVLRGSSRYRQDEEEEGGEESDYQQFVYEPVIRDKSISYVLTLKFNRRLTATVRFSEFFNTVDALRLLIGEFEIDCPNCRRTQSLEYRVSQLELWSPRGALDPCKLRTIWRCAPTSLRDVLKITADAAMPDIAFTQGSIRNYMVSGLVYDGLDCVLINGPADHFNIFNALDHNGIFQEYRTPTPHDRPGNDDPENEDEENEDG
jgi:hypothetical protein